MEAHWGWRSRHTYGNRDALRIIGCGEYKACGISYINRNHANGDTGEGVVAGTVGCSGVGGTKGIGQGDNKACSIGLDTGLGSVGIGISKDMSAYGSTRLEANRCCGCWGGRDDHGLWIIGRSEGVVGRSSHHDGCRAGRNGIEGIVSIDIGCGGVNYAKCVGEGNAKSTDDALRHALRSVAIDIREHMTGDGAQRLEANWRGRGCGSRSNHDCLRVIGGGNYGASRINNVDGGATNRDSREGVVAGSVGGGGVNYAESISQGDRYAGEVCFASALRCVAIHIREHVTRNATLRLETNRRGRGRSSSPDYYGLWIIRGGEHVTGRICNVDRSGTRR